MRAATRLAAVCSALALWGCGGSSGPPSYSYDAGSANLPACAHAGKALPLPSGFPSQFPFPSGTAITSSGSLPQGVKGIGISGFVPSSSFTDTVLFFKNQVKQAGFKLLDFEADAPNDSEGTYLGFGHTGTWQLRRLAGCSGAMHFAASSEPASAAKP